MGKTDLAGQLFAELATRLESGLCNHGVEAPGEGSPRWVRAIAYPLGRTHLSRILPHTAVERIVRVRFGDGVVTQELFLPLGCAGTPADLAARRACGPDGARAPIEEAPARDPAAPSLVGTYEEARARGCATMASADTGTRSPTRRHLPSPRARRTGARRNPRCGRARRSRRAQRAARPSWKGSRAGHT